MIMKRISLKSLSALFFWGILFLVPLRSFALTISPPILDLRGLPGETLLAEITLENETQAPLELSGTVEAFVPGAKKSEREFFSSDEGLASWIALSDTKAQLLPGENKKISLKIDIPKEISGGSYYAAVFWSIAPPEGVASGAAVSSRLGALIFLRVEGEIVENIEIQNFGPQKRFNISFPIVFETKIRNNGNVYLAPKGEIVIETWTGRKIATLPWNSSGGRVLPQGDRIIETKWGEHDLWNEIKYGLFGFYRVSIHISYGAPIKEAGDITSFWFVPAPGLAILIIILVLAVIGVRYGLRKYNKWIIKKYIGR